MFNVHPEIVETPLEPVVVRVRAHWYCGMLRKPPERVAGPDVPIVVRVIAACAPRLARAALAVDAPVPPFTILTVVWALTPKETKSNRRSAEILVTVVCKERPR